MNIKLIVIGKLKENIFVMGAMSTLKDYLSFVI